MVNKNETSLPVNIIAESIGNETVQMVNARDLHAYLGVGRVFSSWIIGRIKEYGFIENIDYLIVQSLSTPNRVSAKSRQKVVIDYHITLDMAKELAMVEKTEKGREARRYFIDCEKRLTQANNSLVLQFTRATLELEKYCSIASNAGRTLCIVGKQIKPKAKACVDELKEKIQPSLMFG